MVKFEGWEFQYKFDIEERDVSQDKNLSIFKHTIFPLVH